MDFQKAIEKYFNPDQPSGGVQQLHFPELLEELKNYNPPPIVTPTYYKPEVEDMFVGYECESLNAGKWEKLTFSVNDFEGLLVDSDGGWLRTRSLSREDLESLGWKYFGEIKGSWYTIDVFKKLDDDFKRGWMDGYKTEITLKTVSFKYPGRASMQVPTEIHRYVTGGFGGGVQHDGVIYNGPIPSINELRQLHRRLKIR